MSDKKTPVLEVKELGIDFYLKLTFFAPDLSLPVIKLRLFTFEVGTNRFRLF